MSQANVHKWIHDIIGDTWHDKDWIIEKVMYGALIHYWEPDGENGEVQLRYQWEADYEGQSEDRRAECKNVYNHLKSAYDWAKKRDAVYNRMWGDPVIGWEEYERLESLFHEEDDKHLTNILKYREYMWT